MAVRQRAGRPLTARNLVTPLFRGPLCSEPRAQLAYDYITIPVHFAVLAPRARAGIRLLTPAPCSEASMNFIPKVTSLFFLFLFPSLPPPCLLLLLLLLLSPRGGP